MATSNWSVGEKVYSGLIGGALLLLAVLSLISVIKSSPTYCEIAIFMKPYLLLSVLFVGFWWYFKRSD